MSRLTWTTTGPSVRFKSGDDKDSLASLPHALGRFTAGHEKHMPSRPRGGDGVLLAVIGLGRPCATAKIVVRSQTSSTGLELVVCHLELQHRLYRACDSSRKIPCFLCSSAEPWSASLSAHTYTMFFILRLSRQTCLLLLGILAIPGPMARLPALATRLDDLGEPSLDYCSRTRAAHYSVSNSLLSIVAIVASTRSLTAFKRLVMSSMRAS